MPINRNSLTAISDNGNIFTAWSETFLIKVYDDAGNYQRAIYYPYKNRTVNFEELDISEHRQEFLTDDNTPDTWPDLHRMFIDDQDRLWIFTITESKTSYQGWVLNTDGELLARFSWPGRRSSRSVRSKPIMVVKYG